MKRKYWFCFFLLLSTGINSPFYSTLYSQEKYEEKIGINYLRNLPENDYIVGPGDHLKVIVSRDYPELYTQVMVDGGGTINIPKLERIYVEGLSVKELNKMLTEAYKKFVKFPEVEVSVFRFRPIKVFVDGEVNEPGIKTLEGAFYASKIQDQYDPVFNPSMDMIEMRKLATLEEFNTNIGLNGISELPNPRSTISTYYFPKVFDAIRASGGISEFSDLSNITIIRKNNLTNGGGKITTSINFEKSLLVGDNSQNIRIYDGDVIKIKRSNQSNRSLLTKAILSDLNPKFLNVFIYGRVRAPGNIKVSRASVLTDAIDMAGGTKVLKGPLTFIRFNADGSIDKRKFNYKKNAKRGSFKNPLLQEGDFIVVGNSPISSANEIITEVTQPFVGIFSTYGLIKAVLD